MKESVIYSISHIYRDDFRVRAFTFGEGEKALCIVGSMRGNEYQQLYICTRLVQRLKQAEAEGRLVPGQQVMIIPCVNPASMNIGKRFWSIDNTDINRMFPGYSLGETTQRIAAGLFEVANKYRYGVQFASYYMPGEFQPHVLMMHTGFENPERAKDFGLPYIAVREPRPYDTTTLNYNWQVWETDAFSLYAGETTRIDEASAEKMADAVEQFMLRNGILQGTPAEAKTGRVMAYSDLKSVRTGQAGIYRSLVAFNARVEQGQALAEVLDACTGDVLETLVSPATGVVFFQHNEPLIQAHIAALKILADEA